MGGPKRGSRESTNSGDDRKQEKARALTGLDLAVDHRPLEGLIPYARNARTHSDAQVAQIAASIKEFGWTNPVLVDGENGVIAGRGRILAARQLGLATVPVIELSRLSEAQRRAYVIADNKLALNAGWDDGLLALELSDLKALDFELAPLGFEIGELDRLFSLDLDRGAAFPDEAPAPPENPVTRAGDLWLLGEHRLLCGDARQTDDVRRVLDGHLADMVFADPPYNVDYQGKSKRRMRISNDALGSAFAAFLEASCRTMLSHCKGALYICMSSSEVGTLKAAFEAAGGHWSTFIVWAKNSFTLGRSDYQRQYEPILYGWPKASDHFWCGARDQGDLWHHDRPVKNDLHPTMKPVALVERTIRNSSKTRDTVLDPFAGSGTTLMAAEAAGRRAALVEIDPRYCDVILRRFSETTGHEPILEGGLALQDMIVERGVEDGG